MLVLEDQINLSCISFLSLCIPQYEHFIIWLKEKIGRIAENSGV